MTTIVHECPPDSVRVDWIKPLPDDMYEGTTYGVAYEITIDTDAFPVVPTEDGGQHWQLPHANLHSCLSSRGVCTPFVQDSPGLSTHTSSRNCNLTTVDGSSATCSFQDSVQLPEEAYTIIAHGRFFVPSAGRTEDYECHPWCFDKYDIATGVKRRVMPLETRIETDAYVTIGLVGGCMLLTAASILWALRKGKLGVGRILQAVLREEVGYLSDTFMLLGECIAFTLSIEQEITQDPRLRDLIPASIFFATTGFAAAGHCTVFVNGLGLWHVWLSKHNQERFFEQMARVSIRALGYKNKVARTLRKALRGTRGRSMLAKFASQHREIQRQYVRITSIVFFDVPTIVIGSLALVWGQSATMVVVLALVLSSLGCGGKASALAFLPTQWQSLKDARGEIETFVKEFDGSRASSSSWGEESSGSCVLQTPRVSTEEESSAVRVDPPRRLLENGSRNEPWVKL